MYTMPIETQDRIALAARMINNTGRHVFLTGKAGTGKTTFLHQLAEATHKNYLIVAPTGIAALNAGGVTIHSQFLLPFGTFLPGDNPSISSAGAFYTRNDLARKHPLNSLRKKVIRSIDLLIIDEVSMLRADLLDAIDYRLRSVKGKYRESFGGVQLLMIGDLYQLPPIVKDNEWYAMRNYYSSAHFFEAQGLKQGGFTYIELEKIFRQSDPHFIDLLNNLRNNCCTAEDIHTLNKAYRPDAEREEGVITLTTHNRQADAINQKEMAALPSSSHHYHAEVEGDFPEHLYPIPASLELKVGAQVMFVKNDTFEKKFFNGKIAKVTRLSEDSVVVLPQDESKELHVGKMVWENKRYTLSDASGQLEEDVVGTYTQYPLKAAWAITVHKSQGLTFDKAVIDVGQAFAPGQVYVALSRLRSLEGLRLRTKINPSVISSDREVMKFSETKTQQEPLDDILRQAQREYLHDALQATFDFRDILAQVQWAMQKMEGKLDFEDAEMNIALHGLHAKFLSENGNTAKFRQQIHHLLAALDFDTLNERIERASSYYMNFLKECNFYLLKHIGEVEMLSRTKTYINLLQEIDQLIHYQMSALLKARHLTTCIVEDRNIDRDPLLDQKMKGTREALKEKVYAYLRENPKNLSTKSGRKRKKATDDGKPPKEKGETVRITLDLYKSGKSIEEIATLREYAKSTIESHLSKLVAQGEIEASKLVDPIELEGIQKLMASNEGKTFGEIFNIANGKYSYFHLRMAQAHLNKLRAADEEDEDAAAKVEESENES